MSSSAEFCLVKEVGATLMGLSGASQLQSGYLLVQVRSPQQRRWFQSWSIGGSRCRGIGVGGCVYWRGAGFRRARH